MGLIPDAGLAAGLGRLTISSAIGQPLVGEIELVSVSKEELSSLGARIASPDAYRSANIQFNPVLVGARVSVERRSGGQPYIRVTSMRPVDEPYLDLLVELTWSTGRLVREYTALIDPPGFGQPQASPPVAATPSAPVAPAAPPARPTAPATPVGADAGAKTYGPVQPGDTLRKIAAGVRPQGVSLDQVLVGIFRSNPDAFINNNMNLLRSGRILRIPEAAELSQINTADAGNEVRVQAGDWNAYRQRAAGAVPEVTPGESRAAAGKITPRVEDAPGAQPPSQEVVKISKGAPGEAAVGEKGLQDRIRVLEEEATAREKTLKDANDRIASLETTIKDMQRLLELKGAVPPALKPDAAKPELKPEAAQPEVKPEAAPPAEKPAVAEPVPTPPAEKPAVAETKPQPKPITPAPSPPAETAWWEDPVLLGSGLVGLGVLGGAGYLLARRRRQEAVVGVDVPAERKPPSVGAAAPAAAAAAAAAPAVAADVPPAATITTEMPAVAPAAAPADDVDPIAEADVYIAYGRDAQAEEILKEALAKNPARQEIKLKLLEIYAARKSKNDFNSLAAELHDATRGRGDLWLKAATMGFALDPDNALYAAGKDSAILPPVGVSTDINLDFDLDMVSNAGAPTTVTDVPLDAGTEDDNVKTTVLSPERMQALQAEGAAMAAKAAESQPGVVPDFDLSTTALSAPLTDITLEPAAPSGPITDINLDVPASATNSNVIDFEFDPSKTIQIEPAAAAAFAHDQTVAISPENQANARDLGVEIDLGSLDVPAAGIVPEETTQPVAEQTADISFDFQLPEEAPPTVGDLSVPPAEGTPDAPEFKPADTTTMDFALDTVSFDLGSQQTREAPAAAPVHDDHWYDVQTKFDLAKAYQEMGDKDGAREILAEVIKEGDDQQKAEAQDLLGKLG